MNALAPDESTPPSVSALPLPSWRQVIALSLPALGHQGLAFTILLSDSYLVGHLNVSDQAAVQAARTTAHYLAWFISCYNVLVTVGSTALVARCIGAGERRLAVEVTHQSLLLAVILGLAATAWAFLGGIRWMVYVLNLEGLAADYATDFALVLFGLIIFQTIEVAGIACLVGAETRTGLFVMIGVTTVNLPLAWGFGWGIGPLPELGFFGVGLGTALSHTLGGLVVLGVLLRGRFGLKLELGLFKPRVDLMYRLLRISIPAGFDSLSVVAGQFWFLAIVNALGNVASSAHGIALVWEGLGYLSGAAFGTAAMTLVGQNLGAKRPDYAARAAWMALALGAAVMSLMGATFYVLAPQMCAAFSSQPEVIREGSRVLRLVAFAMPPLASAIVFTNALRGAGDTRVPVIFTWIGFFVVRIPLAYFLALDDFTFAGYSFHGAGLMLEGCWWAMVADLVLRGVFFFARFVHGAWKTQRV